MIYIDHDFMCHTINPDNTFREIETDFFNDKCDAFIEGYRFVPSGKAWTRDDGTVFNSEMISPFKPCDELDAAQHEFERQKLAEYKAELAEFDAALLDAQYQNIIGGI